MHGESASGPAQRKSDSSDGDGVNLKVGTVAKPGRDASTRRGLHHPRLEFVRTSEAAKKTLLTLFAGQNHKCTVKFTPNLEARMPFAVSS